MTQAITSLGLLLAIGGLVLWAISMCKAADAGDHQCITHSWDQEPAALVPPRRLSTTNTPMAITAPDRRTACHRKADAPARDWPVESYVHPAHSVRRLRD